MDLFIRGIGETVSNMEKELKFGQMDKIIKEIIKMELNQDMEY